jgi:hypothetical protein
MRIKFDTNLTIFALFFGVSLLEAIQTGNLLKSLFWLAIGVVFLLADTFRRRPA